MKKYSMVLYYIVFLLTLWGYSHMSKKLEARTKQITAARQYEIRVASDDWRYMYSDELTERAIKETTNFLKAYAYLAIKSKS